MLTLHETPCRLGKFSNNLDKHGEDDLTSFDVPVELEGMPSEALNELMEDRLFSTRLFDTATPGNPISVGAGFMKLAPLKFRDTFEDTHIDLLLSSSKTPHHFEGVKISKIVLEPCLGGTTKCGFSVHLKPDTDKQILQLLHHQRREVIISVSGGKLVESKKQQDLELAQGEEETHEPGLTPGLAELFEVGTDTDSNISPIR